MNVSVNKEWQTRRMYLENVNISLLFYASEAEIL
jgi:hypothetical protein